MIALEVLHRRNLAFASAALTAACVLPYLRDIYRGTTRPQRASWFVFAALSIVVTVSQFVAGNLAGAWLASGSAIGFTVVFIASIQHGEGGSSRRDRRSLAVASIGVVLSIVVDRPIVAVLAVVVAELSAISLTASKACRDPASETPATWLIDGLAGTAAIAAVATFSPAELLYPIHHTFVNGWVLAAIACGHKSRLLPGEQPSSNYATGPVQTAGVRHPCDS